MSIIYVDIYLWSDPHNVQRKTQKFKGSEFIYNVDVIFSNVEIFITFVGIAELCHVYVRQGSSYKQILIKFFRKYRGLMIIKTTDDYIFVMFRMPERLQRDDQRPRGFDRKVTYYAM